MPVAKAKIKLTNHQEALFNSLNSKLQQETAIAFIRDGYENQTRAYLSACESLNKKPSKNPETSASEILSYPKVIDFLDSIRIEVAENVKVDAEWLLGRLKQIDELDIIDIMNDDLSAFKKLSEWPKIWRTSISGLDIMTISGVDDVEQIVKKLKWPDKVKNLEMIGRHVSVKAWDKEEKKEENKDTTIVLNFTDAVKPDAD
jgi:phage terminase small subunit